MDLTLAQATKTLVTLTLILFCKIAVSQDFRINGSVKDSLTGELLVGTIVRNSNGDGTTSSTEGFFSILTSGKGDVLRFEMLGYKTSTYRVSGLEAAPLTIRMSPDDGELDVVVISAGKFEQKLGEVTVSMEVLKPELLRDKNIITADEALQQTPGVSIVDGEPQIRSGSGYSFGAGSRVQILMDDLPLLSGDAGRPSWGFFPVENISQVEIIKGASSVLYGSAALSGVINMRSAYPSDTAKTMVTLYHGVYSGPRTDTAVYWNGSPMRTGASFLHSQKFGNLDLVIGASYFGDDGHLGPIKDSTSESGYNPFTVDRYAATNRGRINMNLRYRSRKVSGLSYGVNTNWSKSNSLATLLWENSNSGLYSAFNGSATRTIQLLGTIDPFVVYYGSHGNRHSLRTRWQTLDNNNDNNQGNFSDVLYGEYQYQQNWDSSGIHNLTSTVGIVAIHNDGRGQLFSAGEPDGHNTSNNYAAFLQLDKKFFEKLNVSVGMRYEYFEINGESDGRPVFRSGLNYQAGKASYIRASFGQGYRFPSIGEKFITTGVGAINIFSNPGLVAESSYNAEIGFKQGFRIGQFRGFADVAFFYQHFNNFIEFTFAQWRQPVFGPGIDITTALQESIGFKSVNTGEAQVSGFEFSLMGEGRIGTVRVQALMGYTYTQPVSTTPDRAYGFAQDGSPVTYNNTSSDTAGHILKYRMQHLVRADLSGTWKNIMIGGSMRYNSHMQNIDNAFQQLETNFPTTFNPGINQWRSSHTSGDYVIDARVAYSFSARHRLALIMNNVLNREYAIRPLAMEEMRITMLQYVLTL